MHARERLLGTWELIEAKLLNDGIATDYEFSPQRDGGGILIYSADGYMCATMSKRERARFSTDQVDGGTDEEKVKAYSTYIS
jgi:Lipocalin-like domain